ncbi:hypothetical protein CLU79DRAFT_722350 [Phycomyces nitens]|nr:hypothetical protein CLU79DRAFT_722350 [Phycomyces nitens]
MMGSVYLPTPCLCDVVIATETVTTGPPALPTPSSQQACWLCHETGHTESSCPRGDTLGARPRGLPTKDVKDQMEVVSILIDQLGLDTFLAKALTTDEADILQPHGGDQRQDILESDSTQQEQHPAQPDQAPELFEQSQDPVPEQPILHTSSTMTSTPLRIPGETDRIFPTSTHKTVTGKGKPKEMYITNIPKGSKGGATPLAVRPPVEQTDTNLSLIDNVGSTFECNNWFSKLQ